MRAARGESPAAVDRRCIPPGGVAPRSNTAGMLPRHALPIGRITGLGATRDFHHGLLEQVWPQVMAIVRASDPAVALEALTRVRILCVLRRGRYGVDGINARIEARLRHEGQPAGEWTHDRPTLVTANDPHSGLFNGDVGVLVNRQDGRGGHGVVSQPPGPSQGAASGTARRWCMNPRACGLQRPALS